MEKAKKVDRGLTQVRFVLGPQSSNKAEIN